MHYPACTKRTSLYALFRNFVKSHVEKFAEAWHIPAKSEAELQPEFTDPWPQPPSLTPFRDKEAREKQPRAHHKAQAPKTNYFKNDQENRSGYLPVSSGWNANSPSSEHLPLLSDMPGKTKAGGLPPQSHFLVAKLALAILQTMKNHHV